MSILEYFDHSEKKQNKEYFLHLIQVAMADGTIGEMESKMLHRLGKNLGFTDPEIDALLKSTKHSSYHPPYELSKRFEQLYGIVKIILADDQIDKAEMRLAGIFALQSGFAEGEITALLSLLIYGIKEGEEEDDLFRHYRKQIMTLK